MNKTYGDVGKEMGLVGYTFDLYLEYMTNRWADSEETKVEHGYAEEWAYRFKSRHEYQCSDLEGQRVLRELRPGYYPTVVF